MRLHSLADLARSLAGLACSLAGLACWLLASGAHAGQPLPARLQSIPWHVQGESADRLFAGLHDDFIATEADSFVYSNTDLVRDDQGRGYIHNPGENLWFADDAHLILRGRLTEFHFFFFQPDRRGTRFSIAFYDNDPNDLGLGPLLGGPYTVGPYVPGAHIVVVPVTLDSIVVGPDMWFAVAIQDDLAGLALAHPPYVGNTHPLYYDFPAGHTATFDGVPGNFYLRIKVVPETLPVEQVTWSSVKALFRQPQGGRIRSP